MSIGFPIKWHRVAKRNRHAVEWCFERSLHWTMAARKHCRYVHSKLFAVSNCCGCCLCSIDGVNILICFRFLAQPPGVPEICKKSLVSCPASGGLELYILGKNFLKDTRVTFQVRRSASPHRTNSTGSASSTNSATSSQSSSQSTASQSSTSSASSALTSTTSASSVSSDSSSLTRSPSSGGSGGYNDIVWEESVAPDKEYLQQVIWI